MGRGCVVRRVSDRDATRTEGDDVKIQVLYFAGCPNHEPAVTLVREVAAELGIDAEVVEVEVTGQADAQRSRFLGSPTIQVDGVDIEPEARDRVDYAFSCRTYQGEGVPARAMVAAALREAAGGAGTGAPVGNRGRPAPASDPDGTPTGERAGLWAAGGSVISAVAASACCWIPLSLIALGISAGGVSAWFEKYRLLFLGVTAVLLGTGFYFVYFRTPVCAPGSACAAPNPKLRRFNRVMLWVATVVVIVSATFPNYVSFLLAGSASAEATVPAGELATLNLRIEGMTCDGCATIVRSALGDVPGVRSAWAGYPEAEARVGFDPASPPSFEALLGAVEQAGYRAEIADQSVDDSKNPSRLEDG